MIQPQIINVVQNLVVRQISPQSTNGLLPTENDLKSALTNNPANWDSFIYQYVINAIGPVWNTNGSNIQNLILKLKGGSRLAPPHAAFNYAPSRSHRLHHLQ